MAQRFYLSGNGWTAFVPPSWLSLNHEIKKSEMSACPEGTEGLWVFTSAFTNLDNPDKRIPISKGVPPGHGRAKFTQTTKQNL